LLVTVALVMAAMMAGIAQPIMANSPWTSLPPGSCEPEQNIPHDRWGSLFTKEAKNTNADKVKSYLAAPFEVPK
jgi:hypothetical protein